MKNGLGGMFKPVLYVVIIPTIFIAGAIFLTTRLQNTKIKNKETVSLSNTTYKVDKSMFSFGTISMKNGNVETVYELTNTGNDDIYVKELFTSCLCTKAQLILADGSQTEFYGMKEGHGDLNDFYVGKSIKAGETAKVKAIFDPNAHGPQGVGPLKRNITLSTNLKDNPNIQFSFDAEVTR